MILIKDDFYETKIPITIIIIFTDIVLLSIVNEYWNSLTDIQKIIHVFFLSILFIITIGLIYILIDDYVNYKPIRDIIKKRERERYIQSLLTEMKYNLYQMIRIQNNAKRFLAYDISLKTFFYKYLNSYLECKDKLQKERYEFNE